MSADEITASACWPNGTITHIDPRHIANDTLEVACRCKPEDTPEPLKSLSKRMGIVRHFLLERLPGFVEAPEINKRE